MAMSNNLTDILPKILARGLLALRGQVLYTRLVNLDYSTEAKKKGKTIDVPYSSAKSTSAVVPAATPPAPSDSTVKTVPITLDQWEKVNFGITDKEAGEINVNPHYMTLEMAEAFKAMATKINQTVAGLHVNLYGAVGTAGTTPFGTGVEIKSATQARKLMNKQLADKAGRNAILDWDAEAAALELPAFSDAEKVGSGDVKITGEIGRKFGIWWNADEDCPTHTSGTLGGDGTTATKIKASTAHSVGALTLTMTVGATNAMALKKGDIFTIAGDTQQYVATADAAASAAADVSVSIEPALKVALTGGEAITGVSGVGYGASGAAGTNHVANMVFHRDCFALAMRAPGEGIKEIMNNPESVTMGDPVSGLVFRLEVIRQYKQVMLELDALWGVACVRRALGVKILG